MTFQFHKTGLLVFEKQFKNSKLGLKYCPQFPVLTLYSTEATKVELLYSDTFKSVIFESVNV